MEELLFEFFYKKTKGVAFFATGCYLYLQSRIFKLKSYTNTTV